MKIFLSLGIALMVALASMLTDCMLAKPDWEPGVVTGKWIIPAWTEMQSHYDGKGRLTGITTIYHPEQYNIAARSNGRYGNVSVWPSQYGRWNQGDACEIEFRCGRIMNYGFIAIRNSQ